jgi:hypothetical protein
MSLAIAVLPVSRSSSFQLTTSQTREATAPVDRFLFSAIKYWPYNRHVSPVYRDDDASTQQKKEERKKKFPNIISVERNWQNYRKLLLQLRTVWMATAFLLFLLPIRFRPLYLVVCVYPSDRILTCAFQSFAINKNGERYTRDQRKKK